MDVNDSAKKILKLVGGTENIEDVSFCFTRLRFILKDENIADTEAIECIEGVISVVKSQGQYQVVCGAKVNAIYNALTEAMNNQGEYDLSQKESAVDEKVSHKSTVVHQRKESYGARILLLITQIFTPLIPAIAAAGLLKGILTAMKLFFGQRGIAIGETDTFIILTAASQIIFYFFPVFLAKTTASALKCNEIISMLLGGLLVYPAVDKLIQDTAVNTSIFGIPVPKGAWTIGDSTKVFSYTESVIPIILAVIVMSYLERFLKKWIPEVLQLILVPGLELLIMIPLTLCLLGPVGIYIGNVIQFLYTGLQNFSTLFAGALIGGLWGVFVIFGAHRALIPIGLNDVALTGKQNILAYAGAANFAQGGAALGVMLRTKDAGMKQIAASGALAAGIVGVTEPAIYGCNLRLKKPMICAIIAGTIGGAVMGAGNVYGEGFANNGVLTVFTYAAFGMKSFLFYLAGIAIAFLGSAILTYLVGFDDVSTKSGNQMKDKSMHTTKDSSELSSEPILMTESETYSISKSDQKYEIMIDTPLSGTSVSLENIQDEAFASGDLGPGVGIIPDQNEVVAPSDGTVITIFPTGHAIGFETKDGVEILIHIGINTVSLEGKYFEKCVNEGDEVSKGDILVKFDRESIIKSGYDIMTPVIITNADQFKNIELMKGNMLYHHTLFQLRTRDKLEPNQEDIK